MHSHWLATPPSACALVKLVAAKRNIIIQNDCITWTSQTASAYARIHKKHFSSGSHKLQNSFCRMFFGCFTVIRSSNTFWNGKASVRAWQWNAPHQQSPGYTVSSQWQNFNYIAIFSPTIAVVVAGCAARPRTQSTANGSKNLPLFAGIRIAFIFVKRESFFFSFTTACRHAFSLITSRRAHTADAKPAGRDGNKAEKGGRFPRSTYISSGLRGSQRAG